MPTAAVSSAWKDDTAVARSSVWPRLHWKRLAQLSISLAFFALTSGGSKAARLVGRNSRPRLVVLYYHAVRPDQRRRFARQLDTLRAGTQAVVAADFEGQADAGQLLVAVTFDDGFVSVLENALPELAARGMPATIFAPSGLLGRFPDWEMEESSEDRAEQVADGAQLRAIDEHVVKIGAHGVSHPHLPRLDRDGARAEVSGARADLTRLLERDVDLFAFPYGEFDQTVVDLCRDAGYRFAFTTVPHAIDPMNSAFLRGRTLVRPEDWPVEFWLKMRGAYGWIRFYSPVKTWIVASLRFRARPDRPS